MTLDVLKKQVEDPKALYLDLVKKCLKNFIYGNPDSLKNVRGPGTSAMAMVPWERLDNVQHCVEDALARDVPGDLIETGVWRGGCTILMRAILKAHGVTDRAVWVADSFEGLPRPSPEYPHDKDNTLHKMESLAVSLESVQANFKSYDLLDDQVHFLKGWFKDTLPIAPIERIAVMRLDGDMYESTWDALVSLYPKLSVGGYAIIDDYGAFPECKAAVDDYRSKHGISDELVAVNPNYVFGTRHVDGAVYWKRTEG